MIYTPDDYNDADVLKIPRIPGLIMVYLSKYIVDPCRALTPAVRRHLDSRTTRNLPLSSRSSPCVQCLVKGYRYLGVEINLF